MTNLPACQFRGALLENNKVECSCPHLIHPEEGKANIATCLYPCPYRDQATAVAKKESPNLFIKAFNYGTSLIKHALAGFPVVTPEVYKKRLETCLACDQRHAIRTMECTECGCDVEEKASWAGQECGLKKWLKEVSVKPGKTGCRGCGG